MHQVGTTSKTMTPLHTDLHHFIHSHMTLSVLKLSWCPYVVQKACFKAGGASEDMLHACSQFISCCHVT